VFGWLILAAVPGFTLAPEPSLSLVDCVTAAQASSPDLQLARLTLDSASAALVQVKAQNGLILGETAGYYHRGTIPGMGNSSALNSSGINGENLQGGVALTSPATTVGLTIHHGISDDSPAAQTSSVDLSASQIVFDGYSGGRASALVQQAQTVLTVARITYDAAQKTSIYLVKQAYYTLLGDQETLILRQATVAQAGENQDLYEGLFAQQRATRLDLLQVKVALTQAQLDVHTSLNTIVTDKKKLSLAVGWPLNKVYHLSESPLPDLPDVAIDEAQLAAIKNRPELLTLAQNLQAASIALALQKSQGWPVVSLNGSMGVGQDWTTRNNQGTFTVGASVALPPLYDGNLQSAQVKQAADLVSGYELQQTQEGLKISIDVQNALFGAADARDRQTLAVQNLEAAQGQYELERAKRAVGSGTTLDVLTAFSVLATARVGEGQAKTNYLLAVLNLYNVMGL